MERIEKSADCDVIDDVSGCWRAAFFFCFDFGSAAGVSEGIFFPCQSPPLSLCSRPDEITKKSKKSKKSKNIIQIFYSNCGRLFFNRNGIEMESKLNQNGSDMNLLLINWLLDSSIFIDQRPATSAIYGLIISRWFVKQLNETVNEADGAALVSVFMRNAAPSQGCHFIIQILCLN